MIRTLRCKIKGERVRRPALPIASEHRCLGRRERQPHTTYIWESGWKDGDGAAAMERGKTLTQIDAFWWLPIGPIYIHGGGHGLNSDGAFTLTRAKNFLHLIDI